MLRQRNRDTQEVINVQFFLQKVERIFSPLLLLKDPL